MHKAFYSSMLKQNINLRRNDLPVRAACLSHCNRVSRITHRQPWLAAAVLCVGLLQILTLVRLHAQRLHVGTSHS